MALLRDTDWKTSYTTDDLGLVSDFYVPALECAVRYHRATGYFSAGALALAARGVEGLVRNNGTMRLLVGCTLNQAEVEAIRRGESLRQTVDARLQQMPLTAEGAAEEDALELVSWMIAAGHLEVKVAVPCDKKRRPCPADGIFHDKSGVIEDKTGDRLAFNGSVNETCRGWGSGAYSGNWERLTAFCDFGEGNPYVEDVEQDFARLWSDKARRARVIDVPAAMQEDLLRFLPKHDKKPRRLTKPEAPEPPEGEVDPPEDEEDEVLALGPDELRRRVWAFISQAAALPGGGRHVGEATSTVTPWPHQVRAFKKLWEDWPPRMLIGDGVGLGKTITVGLILRQAFLAGRAQRILVLAPKAVLTQWQIELREKLNLNWPIYDGHRLIRYPTRALTVQDRVERKVGRDEWHNEPFVITSSQLMRRTDRAPEVLEQAEPWDLIVLDEAHHARRKGAGSAKEKGPNQLLRLMQALKDRTEGLLLLTATPMQVHPVEVWDLLNLLGLPEAWSAPSFLSFFDKVAAGNPTAQEFETLAHLFREVEDAYGETPREVALRYVPGNSKLVTRKILGALRDQAMTTRKRLSSDRRRAALQIMRANSPVARLLLRHTRELLRRYYEAGKITTPIATRDVRDEFVSMSADEDSLYHLVEDYISTTYNQAAKSERNAVGFVMTIYRRRLASSFAALARTLAQRNGALVSTGAQLALNEEHTPDDAAADEVLDAEETARLEREALKAEESADIACLLDEVTALPTDTKAVKLLQEIGKLREDSYDQVMVFTQYTDTMDFLRGHLTQETDLRVLCFSGRGGELPGRDGSWRKISRDEIKRIFREGGADVLLCTDAASEGLNFQFCGALINYDMPWNPMRVEQRIGRIDRLGQRFPEIRIINLHYRDTVEADVYHALRQRIQLFSQFVGKLQPILSRLPRAIGDATLATRAERDRKRATLVSDIDEEVRQAETQAFDLDAITDADLEEPPRPRPLLTLDHLDHLLQRPDLLPPGVEVKPLGKHEYQFSLPGLPEPVRVTTDPAYYEEHPGSTELWAPGCPVFPVVEEQEENEESELLETWRVLFQA